ncbi:MAG: IS200/IS605 family transposase [Phycisphaerales bacterium]
MPSTWSRILLHFVFTTRNREPLIAPPLAKRLYPFIGGTLRAEGATLWEIGGTPDHIHLLVRSGTDHSAGELMREIKARSSAWIHGTFPESRDFAWQKGYGVFSVSASQADVVKHYIRNQEEHHRERNFISELRLLLEKHGVEFEEKYLE